MRYSGLVGFDTPLHYKKQSYSGNPPADIELQSIIGKEACLMMFGVDNAGAVGDSITFSLKIDGVTIFAISSTQGTNTLVWASSGHSPGYYDRDAPSAFVIPMPFAIPSYYLDAGVYKPVTYAIAAAGNGGTVYFLYVKSEKLFNEFDAIP